MAFATSTGVVAFTRRSGGLRTSLSSRRWRVRDLDSRVGRARMMAGGGASKTKGARDVTDSEWRQRLTPMEYRVLREKGTERAGTGEYEQFYPEEGYFACRACGNPLYSAESKFRAGCGWPAFDKCYKGSIKVAVDNSYGMRRIEIMCNNCDGHLGHVFEGERMTATNERHCVNSVSVRYVEGKVDAVEGKLM